jgi:hypothetical protein
VFKIARWYSAGLWVWWSGVRVPAVAVNFSLRHNVQTGSGAHTAFCPVGTRGSFYGVKRPVREANYSPPSSAEVKNASSCTSNPQYAFITWCSVKAQGRIYLYLYYFLRPFVTFRFLYVSFLLLTWCMYTTNVRACKNFNSSLKRNGQSLKPLRRSAALLSIELCLEQE